MAKGEVFVSYAWGGNSEEIVDKIDAAFKDSGITLVRDKRDLDFKERITDFMKEIGQGRAVITVISDKYLKSPYCMFEMLEMFRNSKMSERIFPILLPDAKIFDPVQRLEYSEYWKAKKAELDAAIEKYGPDAITVIGPDFIIYKRICDNIGEILNLLRDINSLTPQAHEAGGYEKIIKAVRATLTDHKNEPASASSISQIKKLIDNSFDDTSLQGFCMEHFKTVYDNFAAGQDKSMRIMALIGYCQRHLKLDELLKFIRDENPEQYNNFKSNP